MAGSAILFIFAVLCFSPKSIGEWLGAVRYHNEKKYRELSKKTSRPSTEE